MRHRAKAGEVVRSCPPDRASAATSPEDAEPPPASGIAPLTGLGRADAIWTWLGPLLAVLLAVAPALYWGGRYVDVEALGFLQHYWGEGSVLERILDPRAVDFYRGRELSYAVDFLDAQWMRLLLGRGIVFFLAPSALLASLALVALTRRLGPRAFPGLGIPVLWLGLLVLLSNFVFLSTMGIYYRSTKTLLAPLLLALLLLVVAEARHPRLGPRAGFGAVLGLTLALSLLDRQGLFFSLLTTLFLGVLWAFRRRSLPLLLGGLTALGLWAVYDHTLGPALIHAVNGYWPDMAFQRLRPASLVEPSLWVQAAGILGDWTSALLAGLPPLLLGAAATIGAVAWGWADGRRPGRVAVAVTATLALGGALVAMVTLMLERHPPVSWEGNRLWYYPLSSQVLLVVVLLWVAERLVAHGWGRRSVPVVLGVVVVANMALWPALDLRMHTTAAFADQKRQAGLLAESLEGRAAVPSLAGEYRRFYFDALDRFALLAARAAPQVSEGGGIGLAEVREGRLTAWCERESQIVPRTTHGGSHVLSGGVLLRPNDRLLVLLGSRGPRLLAEVRGDPAREGPVFFHVTADLGAGANDVRLVSRAPEGEIPGEAVRASFALMVPVAVWPLVD
jgi:hypothetical protein